MEVSESSVSLLLTPMKIRAFPGLICWPCLCLILLTGCKEQENELREWKDSVSRTQESKEAAATEMKELESQLVQARQAVKDQQSLRQEFEAKALKSAAGAKLAVKFREELEASLSSYADAVSAYRKKYLTP